MAKSSETTGPPVFLWGENVHLRALVPEDVDGPYVEWFNDAEVCAANGHHYYPYTRDDALAYIDRARKSEGELILAIVRTDHMGHIGNITLKHIDPISRSAEYAIIIGDKESWGKGFAKEASRLILDHAFTALNLRRIYSGTLENNAAIPKLNEYLGMREEGRRRKAVYKNGRYRDVIEYGLLREEYEDRFGSLGGDA